MKQINIKKTCKECKYKNVCGNFRDKYGRCPENMVGKKDRFELK